MEKEPVFVCGVTLESGNKVNFYAAFDGEACEIPASVVAGIIEGAEGRISSIETT